MELTRNSAKSYFYNMEDFPDKLLIKLQQRKEEGAFRSLLPPTSGVDFSSNDYLGFARSEAENTRDFASGSTGSRLISGNHHLYEEAEATVADFHRAGAALIFNSGYDANLGLLSACSSGTITYFTTLRSMPVSGMGLPWERRKATNSTTTTWSPSRRVYQRF